MTQHWQATIGLEIHMQLSTSSKLFSGAQVGYGGKANTRSCMIDAALPGILPVVNERAIGMAIAFGLAVEGKIAEYSVFARKNYFYPDLPKGYQISQYENPIVSGGRIPIESADGTIRYIALERAHLEEDAGKLIHDAHRKSSYVDLNRAGTALIEIVSKPVMESATEAVAYMKQIHAIGCYLDICDGNMQEGSLRCDANVSVRRKGDDKLGVRTETKNLNSFRFIEKAILYEIDRQIEALESGQKVVQETRLYDADADETRVLRSKEEAEDYRYFPEPDLLPVRVTQAWIDKVRNCLPELKHNRSKRFIVDYRLTKEVAEQLTKSKEMAEYFEECVRRSSATPKFIANLITTQLAALLNRDKLTIADAPLSAKSLCGLIDKIDAQTISINNAKIALEKMWQQKCSADEVIEALGLEQINDDAWLNGIVDEIIKNNPQQVEQYLAGKEKVLSYFIGLAMKISKGKANPAQLTKLFKACLRKQG
ncbi:MAG: Asp-tRNA(Asn)/Glu-tRNA(Gln) amidotransferase subunit GatB [Chromatiales bacterium]|nr:Asp-tRNA(Asn)/Glu-tRNA(Gln) amidotransferase subunit GatB [Chromatiales bacterium]